MYGPRSTFAQNIMNNKYAKTKADGTKETWEEVARRVTDATLSVVSAADSLKQEIFEMIRDRKFMPGGRYLYASGNDYHQTQNCLLLRAEDSREGWSELMYKSSMALMSGAGIGIDYSAVRPEGSLIKRTGGFATGPLALLNMVNEAGRNIMQGGSRRSAIWAGLNWKHQDVIKFIVSKNWSDEVRKLKAKDFNFPAPLDGTNISVILDKSFFDAYSEPKNPMNSHAHNVYWAVVRQMLSTSEPGFSVDYYNGDESLRNAPVTKDTRVLTNYGYRSVAQIIDIPVTLWTGHQWTSNVIFKLTKKEAQLVTVQLSNGRAITCDPEHPFMVKRYLGAGSKKKTEIVRIPAAELCADDKILSTLPEQSNWPSSDLNYGLGYVFGDGSILQGHGELSVHTESKRTAFTRACESLNARTVSSPDRAYFKTKYSTKSELLDSYLSPEFIAGWFDADGNLIHNLLRISNKNRAVLHTLQEALDMLGIKSTVREDGESSYKPGNKVYTLLVVSTSLIRFSQLIPTVRLQIQLPSDWKPYRESEIRVVSIENLAETQDVYCCDVGVPEHSFMAEGVIISNCCEITSEDDSDICNLGSLNLAQIKTLEDFNRCRELATAFLLAGTVYSHVPYEKVDTIRAKNRRLGLGLMGIHEWLLMRNKSYGPDAELSIWLDSYTKSNVDAEDYAKEWSLSVPIKTRAIAPNGTIGIVAETTTGIEPIFCAAYKRRYLKGTSWHYEYVLDPTAKRLVDSGVSPDAIEDAYTLAENVERRVEFQAYVQQYVDHAISSTINLPAWGSELNNDSKVQAFGTMLLKYLPKLRGMTCYADGSRGGQPLNPVKYQTAIKHADQIFVEGADICEISNKGSCGT